MIEKAIILLDHSLIPIPQELNELDWKEDISPNNIKLCKHISAFANLPGGGFMVFGIENKAGKLLGVNQVTAEKITQKLSSLCRDSISPIIRMDHSIQEYKGVSLLFIYLFESHVKPVHLKEGSIEDSYIRSGGCTRKASRQEIGGLLLNSKTPQFEELYASELKTGAEVMDMLDYRSIFKTTR